MTDRSREPRERRLLSPTWLTGTVAFVLVGAVATLWSAEDRVLHAAAVAGVGGDLDGDGLPDALEQRLGCNPTSVDSDGDGVGDIEEVARKSDPAEASWLPLPSTVAINLVPYVDGGVTRLLTVMYAADGNFNNKPFSMGARIGKTVRTAPLIYFTKNASFSSHTGKVAGSAVFVVDSPLEPTLLERFDSISFYSLIKLNGVKVDAGVADMALIDGVVVEYTRGNLIASTPGRLAGPTPSFGVYGPVDADAILEWTPGEICGQTTAVQATLGPVIIEEVLDAGCEPGWDSFCDPGCSATVGETVQRLDPAALVFG